MEENNNGNGAKGGIDCSGALIWQRCMYHWQLFLAGEERGRVLVKGLANGYADFLSRRSPETTWLFDWKKATPAWINKWINKKDERKKSWYVFLSYWRGVYYRCAKSTFSLYTLIVYVTAILAGDFYMTRSLLCYLWIVGPPPSLARASGDKYMLYVRSWSRCSPISHEVLT